MTNLLLFADSLLCWQLANYAFYSDPVRDEEKAVSHKAPDRRRLAWLGLVAGRSFAGAFLITLMGGFGGTSWLLACVVLAGSMALPLTRKWIIPVAWLAEFELAANGAAVLVLWLICIGGPNHEPRIWFPNLSASQLATVGICAALLIYVIRGGNFFVRGILEKAGGLPIPDQESQTASGGYRHGAVIGQIERIIVVLVVTMGSYETLAFFFAAKGLIRSKELEDRSLADYFLLGSLSSFLWALAGGLVIQKTIVALWR